QDDGVLAVVGERAVDDRCARLSDGRRDVGRGAGDEGEADRGEGERTKKRRGKTHGDFLEGGRATGGGSADARSIACARRSSALSAIIPSSKDAVGFGGASRAPTFRVLCGDCRVLVELVGVAGGRGFGRRDG